MYSSDVRIANVDGRALCSKLDGQVSKVLIPQYRNLSSYWKDYVTIRTVCWNLLKYMWWTLSDTSALTFFLPYLQLLVIWAGACSGAAVAVETLENLFVAGWSAVRIFWSSESRRLLLYCQDCAAAPPFTESWEISRASLWTLSLKDSPLSFLIFGKRRFPFQHSGRSEPHGE